MATDDVKLCWLNGSYWQRQNTLGKIKDSFKGSPVVIFDEYSPAINVSSSIGGADLFGQNKLVVLNGLPTMDDKSEKNTKKIIDMLARVSDGSVVIINGVSPTERPSVFRFVEKNGKVFEFPHYLDRPHAISWFSSRVNEAGKITSKEACEAFVDRIGVEYGSGVNIDKMYVEFRKLISYIGKNSEVSVNDVEMSVTQGMHFVIWNLRDAINRKDYCTCIELFHNALGKDSFVSNVVNNVLGTLVWQYRLLIFIKEMLAAKKSDQEVVTSCKTIHKFARKGRWGMEVEKTKDGEPRLLYSENTINTAMNGVYGGPSAVGYFKRVDLYKLMKVAEETIAWTRSGTSANPISDIDMIFAVETFFMAACGVMDDDMLSLVRRPFDG